MDKKNIHEILRSFYKEDLKNLGYKIGLRNLSRLTMDELIQEIVKKNGSDNLNMVIENINKSGLEIICRYYDLPYTNKKKEELLFLLKNRLNHSITNSNKEVKFTIDEKRNKSLEKDEDHRLYNDDNIETPFSKKNDLKISNSLTYFDNIKCFINNIDIPKEFIASGAKETQIQSFVLSGLQKQNFQAKENFSIGGYFNLLIDIDIDKGEFGIEIKIWNHLKGDTKEISRAIGQAYIYSTERYKNGNYMFLMFCKLEDQNDQKLRDFSEIIKKLNGKFLIRVIY